MATASELRARLEAEAEQCYSWSNGPGDTYAEHTHAYTKVLYCVEGAIDFLLRDGVLHLSAGERMEQPAGTPHSAQVGPAGCLCIEGAALMGKDATSGHARAARSAGAPSLHHPSRRTMDRK